MTKFTGFSIFLSIGLSMHIATLCAQDLVLKVKRQDSYLIYQQYITPGDTIKQGTYYKYIAAGKVLNESGFYKNNLKDSTWQVYDSDSKTVIEKYNYKSGIKEGRSSYFNLNGKLIASGTFEKDSMVGEWKYYFPNGNIRRKIIFKYGAPIGVGSAYNMNSFATEEFNFDKKEFWKKAAFSPESFEEPYFFGGNEAMELDIKYNMRYPREARITGKSGVVMCEIVISAKGQNLGAKIISSSDPVFNQEALRLCNGLEGWIPAKIDGFFTKSSIKVPISFRLN